MSAHRIYTPEQFRAVKRERSRQWRIRNRGRESTCTRLMRWYGSLSQRAQLRIVLRAIGCNADEMLGYIMYLRARKKKRLQFLTGA